MEKNGPMSCDTFVVLPPLTENGCVVFGKNSDRPNGEVQEIVYVPAEEHPAGDKLKCTYIEIEQVGRTHAVILSKPAWMWGAEMGANEHGVVIGNEAVWTKLNDSTDDLQERLLGMDFVRLGLERSQSAKEALDVISSLLEKHGQGGPCSDTDTEFSYHNSFLIADRSEAWILETAGSLWAAENIKEGYRNISNSLSIETKIDACSSNLQSEAQAKGLWDPASGEFDFTKVFSSGSPCDRKLNGEKLLSKLTSEGSFSVKDMFEILRDKESGICRENDHARPTAGSQVSVLSPPGNNRPCCHWFTGTPDPSRSVFKPFIFCPTKNRISPHIQSPNYGDSDPAKTIPRFQKTVDRQHKLYKQQQQAMEALKNTGEMILTLRNLEARCVADMDVFLANFKPDSSYSEVEDLFKDIVESEMKFYK